MKEEQKANKQSVVKKFFIKKDWLKLLTQILVSVQMTIYEK